MANTPALLTQVTDLRDRLATTRPGDDPVALIDLITALEELKSAACAVQARAAVAYDTARGHNKATAAEVALARKVSPHRGRVLLGMASILCTEMPCTLDRLTDGTLDEHKALVLVKETALLTREDRAAVDATLCGSAGTLEGVGVRRLEAQVQAMAYQLDPAGFVKRRAHAVNERHVTLRPAPDTMTYLTALLPVEQGVAAYAALAEHAKRQIAAGDERGKGQLMADHLVAALTGLPETSDGVTVPVCVNITLSDTTLAGGNGAAAVEGTPVPAEVARILTARAVASGVGAWFRRLYTHRGRLVAMSSRSRLHGPGLAEFLNLRDAGICRTPYCDAPVRHHDHITPAADGGPTSAVNGQGLCEACNQAKEQGRWKQTVTAGLRHRVQTTTGTGHTYSSTAPPPPGTRLTVAYPQGLELRLAALLHAA